MFYKDIGKIEERKRGEYKKEIHNQQVISTCNTEKDIQVQFVYGGGEIPDKSTKVIASERVWVMGLERKKGREVSDLL